MNKWSPFTSIISTNNLTKDLTKPISKPCFSEEQIKNMENQIIEAYQTKSSLIFTIYNQGFPINIIGQIKKINATNGEIILINQKKIYFTEIIKVIPSS